MSYIKNTDSLVEGVSKLFHTNERAKAAVQTDLDSLSASVSSEQSRAQAAESGLDSRLDVIEGSGEGSVAKAEQDAKDYADQKVADLVNSAPAVLDTLKELADALGQDPNFAVTISNQVGAVDDKVDQEISDRQAAVSAEQQRAQNAESALDGRLDIIEGSGEGSVAKAEQDAKDYADGLMSAEQSARESADNALDGRLDVIEGSGEGSVAKAEQDAKDYADGIVAAEQSARESADSALDGRLDALEADPATGAQITQLQSDLAAEQSARESADSALDGRLDVIEGSGAGSIAKAKQDAESYALGLVQAEESARQSAVSGEQSAREAADNALDARLDVLEADPTTKTYVDGEVSDLQGQITQEISDRQAGDSALDGRLDVLESDPTTKTYVDGEVSDLQGQINQEISNRQSAVSSEQSRAEAAESALDARLDVIEGSGEGSVAKAEQDAKDYADQKVADLVNSAPAVLDTLKELSDALGGDANFAATVAGQIGGVEGRLDVIEGSGEGSVAKAEQDAKDYTDSEISSFGGTMISGLTGQVVADVTTLVNDSRTYALNEANSLVDGVSQTLTQEISDREAGDNALDARLDVLEADPTTKSYVDTGLAGKVDVTANYDIKPGLYQGGSKSANFTINWANGPFQQFTLGASVTVTLSNPVSGGSYMLKLVQDGTGSRQVTWPASVKWANGEAPTLSGASKVDFVQMMYDGTNYYGNYQLEDVTFARSSELTSQVATLNASITAEASARAAADTSEANARAAEDLTFFKLDGSRAMTGGLKVKHSEKSASYTLVSSDYIIGVTSVTGSKTMTLPSASAEGAGKMYKIKDQSGAASQTNYIRVAAPAGQTLDGQSYYDIKVPYEAVAVFSNGSNWFII